MRQDGNLNAQHYLGALQRAGKKSLSKVNSKQFQAKTDFPIIFFQQITDQNP